MEAPEKIYLQACGDCNDNDCENCKFEDLEDNVTWCKDKIFDKDIEYIRADAFVDLEKEIQNVIHNHFFDLNGIAIAGTSSYATVDDMVYIAKHFFELGLKAKQG